MTTKQDNIIIMNIVIGIDETGFFTRLNPDVDCQDQMKKSGFKFVSHSITKMIFSFDNSLKNWSFSDQPVTFTVPTGDSFSGPSTLHQESINDRSPPAPTQSFSIVSYGTKSGAYRFDLNLIDPSGNRITIDPTTTVPHHP